jgi:hypothetical protein
MYYDKKRVRIYFFWKDMGQDTNEGALQGVQGFRFVKKKKKA